MKTGPVHLKKLRPATGFRQLSQLYWLLAREPSIAVASRAADVIRDSGLRLASFSLHLALESRFHL